MAFIAHLYLLAVVVQPAEWINFFDGIPVQELILLIGILGMLVSKLARLKIVISSVPGVSFLLFIIIAILSVSFMGFSYAIGEEVGRILFKYYLGFLLISVAYDSEDKFRNGLIITVFAGLLVAYLGILLKQTGVGVGAGIGFDIQELNWRGGIQWIGTFGGSNTSGQLYLFLFSLAFGLAYKEPSKFKKVFFLCSSIYIGYAFLLTGSRGGFLGMLGILGFYAYIKTGVRLKFFIPLVVIGLVLVFTLKPQEEGRGVGESTTPERIELYHQGLQMFKNNPISGVGYNQFPRNNPVRKTAHNIFLNTLAETGFFGLFCFILMYYSSIKALLTYKNSISETATEFRPIMATNYATISIGISSFFLSSHHDLPYIVLALLVIPTLNRQAKFHVTPKEYKNIFLILAAIIGLIYGAIQAFFILFR